MTNDERRARHCPLSTDHYPLNTEHCRLLPATCLLPSSVVRRWSFPKPLAGITCIATPAWQVHQLQPLPGFKPLAGITCIATRSNGDDRNGCVASFKPLAGITCIATNPLATMTFNPRWKFQTPRGNYLHCNWNLRRMVAPVTTRVSNPSRELPALQLIARENPFNQNHSVSNPSRELPALQPGNFVVNGWNGYNVSNPSRELPALQPRCIALRNHGGERGFKPLAGITCIATRELRGQRLERLQRFKPLAGITCIATKMHCPPQSRRREGFQTPRGNYLHCNKKISPRKRTAPDQVSNPSRELPALQLS